MLSSLRSRRRYSVRFARFLLVVFVVQGGDTVPPAIAGADFITATVVVVVVILVLL